MFVYELSGCGFDSSCSRIYIYQNHYCEIHYILNHWINQTQTKHKNYAIHSEHFGHLYHVQRIQLNKKSKLYNKKVNLTIKDIEKTTYRNKLKEIETKAKFLEER